ncbi:putative glucuronoxylan glucuronosyltransferase IRX7 isoform X1 [Tasmannia lanceolata]|uniref:putative glucuronoxylan glucuronosyltransferase IRX7 isoform X1 n=1 Tax=Tasmannia lanceolata TaxID=3420 RepID=UPI004062CA2C
MLYIKRSSKTKGLNPKMKLRRNDKTLCYKYFRWFLWFSLFIYFFSSYLISPFNKTIILPKTTVSQSQTNFISRALIETLSNATDSFHGSVQRDLKIYIYELPSEYNRDWLRNERCSNHLFGAEVAIHEALMRSDVRTFVPSEADFFFVPVYVSCNFSTVNGFPAIGHARRILASAVHFISSQMPFWNRSSGSDHVFVASHDFGACFHTMEDVAISDGIPSFLKKSIILQTFGVKSRHPCQEVENVLIPPYISPESVRSTLEAAAGNGERDIWVFFRGKMEVHPKNISGRFYSKGVRTAIWNKYNRNRKFYIKRKRFTGYQSEIVRSVFCLCPLGWAPWSPRLVESVALGCVPVIIADDIRLPFPESVPWPEISLRVAEKDVGKLERILEHVSATNLSDIQCNLWDPSNRRALLFNRQLQVGDATWQVLDALSRSLRRSRVLNQSDIDTRR